MLSIYVICNPNVEWRKRNMVRRLTNLGLIEHSQFIPGGNIKGDLCQHYDPKFSKVTGCLIGHLNGLRKFVDDGAEHGCIVEDDILFRNDFYPQAQELIKTHPDQPLIQLFTVNALIDSPCQYAVYGTQGYIISRKYAQEALLKYDRPLRYWSPEIFQTSEAITMYSGGICLGRDPLIIEDGLTYTVSGPNSYDVSFEPNETQKSLQLVSYRAGLYKYIGCDPEFKISAETFTEIANSITAGSASQIDSVLKITTAPSSPYQEMVLALYYMLSGWYLDRTVADSWAKRFFSLISTGLLYKQIEQWQSLIKSVVCFYHPETKPLISAQLVEKAKWDNEYNWLLVPNSHLLDDNSTC